MDIETAINLINTKGLKTAAGKYVSRAMNESWFMKNNLKELYVYILSETSVLSGRKFSERVWALEHLPIPNCECGMPVKKHDTEPKWSMYCSKRCALTSNTRAKNISKAQLSRDHSDSNEKRKQTMLQKYGTETNSQRTSVKQIISAKLSKNQLSPLAYDKLNDVDWLFSEYVEKDRSSSDIARELGCDYSAILARARLHGWKVKQVYSKSMVEKQISEFISGLGFHVTSPTDKLLGKKEIDVFVESKKLGIEIDGLYWHSYSMFETIEQRNKHLQKSLVAQANGIDLIHFTDEQWYGKQSIVKSMVKSKLGVASRIPARKCKVVELDIAEAKQFLMDNHIQGYVGSAKRLGLVYEDKLMAVMTFGIPRYDKSYSWELLRFSTILDTTVVGGFSKLLHQFKSNNVGSILSYADRMRSNGNVYLANGFSLIRETPPGYFWTDGNKSYPRTQFSKKLLKSKLAIYDENLSEAENMFANGYKRFWDCGQLVFGLK